MRQSLFIVTLFLVTSVYAQTEKASNIPTYTNYKNEIDTTLWYKWKHALSKQINLKDLQTTNDTFHFRLWTAIQEIDIWKGGSTTYFGLLTNYAQRYDEVLRKKGIYKIDKVFSNQINIDSSKAKKIFDVITELSILSIPTDEKIKGWLQGFDGEEFLIETSTPTQYDFKTYWTPRAFIDSLKEAKQIQTLVDYLYKNLKIYEYYQKLNLPEGSYQRNGIPGIKINVPSINTTGATTITDLL